MAPPRDDGNEFLETYSTQQLALIAAFLSRACEIQEARTRQLRTWLAIPSSPARRTHLRGGLSRAPLRRVRVFVEANLAARFIFARAFKTSRA